MDTLVDLANALNVTTDILLKDSLVNDSIVLTNEFAAILGDCSDYELKLMLDILVTVKASIRANQNLFYRCYPRR